MDAVTASLTRSARRQSLALGISRRSFHRILNDELKFHPYKLMVVHQMSERDLISRKEFCERMIDILEDDPNTV